MEHSHNGRLLIFRLRRRYKEQLWCGQVQLCPYLDVVDSDIALLDGVDGVGDDDNHADCDDGGEKADDQETALRVREVGHPAARVLPPATAARAARVGARTASFRVPNFACCRRDTNQSVVVVVLGVIRELRCTCVDGRSVGLGRTELLLKLRIKVVF